MAAMRKVATAAEFRDVLNERQVRITFGFAFGVKGTMLTAHLEVGEIGPGGRQRWTKVTPMLVERDGGGRADLLQQMVDVLTMDQAEEVESDE